MCSLPAVPPSWATPRPRVVQDGLEVGSKLRRWIWGPGSASGCVTFVCLTDARAALSSEPRAMRDGHLLPLLAFPTRRTHFPSHTLLVMRRNLISLQRGSATKSSTMDPEYSAHPRWGLA